MLLILLALAAHADSIRCEATATKGLVYEQGSYVGGAAPGGEIPVFWERWALGEARLYDATRLADGSARTTGDLVWAWDPAATRTRASTRPSEGITRTVYTASVTLSRADGAPIEGVAAGPITMRCERFVDRNFYP